PAFRVFLLFTCVYFRDSLPTVVPPLSLHDALPISLEPLPGFLAEAIGEILALLALGLERRNLVGCVIGRRLRLEGKEGEYLTDRDRKSTRLNSITRSYRMPSSA